MREIKFRAWHPKRKEMYYHDFWDIDRCMIVDCKIMQFTGLKDKSGEEIYEGDILDLDGNEEHNVVEFLDGKYIMNNSQSEYHQIAEFQKAIALIGNIYENAELLSAEMRSKCDQKIMEAG